MKRIVITLTAILILSITANALTIGKSAAKFNLEDQSGKVWKLSKLNGSVVVVLTANQESGKLVGPWLENLKTKYGSKIHTLGLLDLHTVPALGQWIAKSQIKKLTSEPLMLDFNGSTAKAYSVSSKHPVITVIDNVGIIRSVQKSEFTKTSFAKTKSAIDKALKVPLSKKTPNLK
jgi:peroxiredoxin